MQKPKMNLKKLRKERGWTQQELADKLNFSRSYIATIEDGKHQISTNMMFAIIQKFDIKYEDFYQKE